MVWLSLMLYCATLHTLMMKQTSVIQPFYPLIFALISQAVADSRGEGHAPIAHPCPCLANTCISASSLEPMNILYI